jgi:hypothetical protein
VKLRPGAPPVIAELTREDILTAAREAAAQSGASVLSRKEFERLTKISQYHIYKHFPGGGWSEVVQLAGLNQHPLHREPITDEELLSEFHAVVSDLGRIPTWHQFSSRAAYSAETVSKRFRGLSGTRERYRVWLQQHDPDSPFLDELKPKRQDQTTPRSVGPRLASGESIRWPKGIGIQYGPPMSFRGLRHAPVNEQGVVYLFGMVSTELGFLVEAIHGSFPDCIAKRSVDAKGDRWQQVLIEFEYRSGNFREHNHDVSACDVIVCWQHDWPECPLEVVELSTVIRDLPD